MQTVVDDRREAPAAIRNDLGAIFVSLELSRSTWLITSLSPGGGEKMSKHSVRGGDVAGLLERFAQLQKKAQARTGGNFPIIVIQEAGLDGFWIHRVLQKKLKKSQCITLPLGIICTIAPAPLLVLVDNIGRRHPDPGLEVADSTRELEERLRGGELKVVIWARGYLTLLGAPGRRISENCCVTTISHRFMERLDADRVYLGFV